MEDKEVNTGRHLFKVLGELSSDVKHILVHLDRIQQDQISLRAEIKNDVSGLATRVTKLETFNTKMMAAVAVVLPPVVFFLNSVATYIKETYF